MLYELRSAQHDPAIGGGPAAILAALAITLTDSIHRQQWPQLCYKRQDVDRKHGSTPSSSCLTHTLKTACPPCPSALTAALPGAPGTSPAHASSDPLWMGPGWFSSVDNPPHGARQEPPCSFNFGHNSDLWAVCIISLCCRNPMNLSLKVSRLYFSISFQTCLYCLLHLFSCKKEWLVC